MDIQVVELISSVGFPIVMCLYMMFTTNKALTDMNATLEKLCTQFEILISTNSKEGKKNDTK